MWEFHKLLARQLSWTQHKLMLLNHRFFNAITPHLELYQVMMHFLSQTSKKTLQSWSTSKPSAMKTKNLPITDKISTSFMPRQFLQDSPRHLDHHLTYEATTTKTPLLWTTRKAWHHHRPPTNPTAFSTKVDLSWLIVARSNHTKHLYLRKRNHWLRDSKICHLC